MNKQLFSLAAFSLLTAGASAQSQVWSQSTDNTTITAGSASCLNNPAGITDNSYWRRYDPIVCGLTTDYEITEVIFGVENATTTSGAQNILVNIRNGTTFPAGAGAAAILGSVMGSVPDTDVTMQTFITFTFSPPVFVTAGTKVAVEVKAFNGQPQGDFFFIGSNMLGETPIDSTYISATDCGIVDPVPYAAVGFPGVAGIIDLRCNPAGPMPIGTNYCAPSIPNSTGNSGHLSAVGSTAAAAQNVQLTASSLPPGQPGYFVASRTQGFIANPGGSTGNLCVVGNQARYRAPGQVFFVTPGGTGSLQVGNINVPTNPAPGEVIAAGDSWNWQAWYRDAGMTNNFTDGLNILFN
jgi:hypothetical protein